MRKQHLIITEIRMTNNIYKYVDQVYAIFIYTGWWFVTFFFVHNIWEESSQLTNIFSEGLKPPTICIYICYIYDTYLYDTCRFKN